MKKVFVKPAPGLKIRIPGRLSDVMPESGAEVELTDYWRNRLRDGDVTLATAATAAKAAPAKK